jgi:hypothetical protein
MFNLVYVRISGEIGKTTVSRRDFGKSYTLELHKTRFHHDHFDELAINPKTYTEFIHHQNKSEAM